MPQKKRKRYERKSHPHLKQRVAEICAERGLTKEQFKRLTGISYGATDECWRSPHLIPSIPTLVKIGSALGMPWKDLVEDVIDNAS